MCRILRVWKLKTSINISHLLDFKFSGGPAPNQPKDFMCPGGFGRCWKAPGGSICCILRVWKVLGGSMCRILRVWKALGGSTSCILYAARRPADPVKSCPCFILRRFLPRAYYLDICFFCAPEGRIAPIGASNRRRVVLFRIDDLIPNRLSDPALHPWPNRLPRV